MLDAFVCPKCFEIVCAFSGIHTCQVRLGLINTLNYSHFTSTGLVAADLDLLEMIDRESTQGLCNLPHHMYAHHLCNAHVGAGTCQVISELLFHRLGDFVHNGRLKLVYHTPHFQQRHFVGAHPAFHFVDTSRHVGVSDVHFCVMEASHVVLLALSQRTTLCFFALSFYISEFVFETVPVLVKSPHCCNVTERNCHAFDSRGSSASVKQHHGPSKGYAKGGMKDNIRDG
mmetsp:Transcript_78234/g.155069  ORF Transcript_78234/g.155069 Transcript_78234/m.155069 type:complete len:229 (+) Transcript_78234:721-1407(+)